MIDAGASMGDPLLEAVLLDDAAGLRGLMAIAGSKEHLQKMIDILVES